MAQLNIDCRDKRNQNKSKCVIQYYSTILLIPRLSFISEIKASESELELQLRKRGPGSPFAQDDVQTLSPARAPTTPVVRAMLRELLLVVFFFNIVFGQR